MSEIVICVNNKATKRVSLIDSKVCIGRHKNCDIILTDRTVSLRHAQIITLGGDSFLEDLASTNGTFVNRRRIKRDVLHVGDVITIGKYYILYQTKKATSHTNEAWLIVQNGIRKGEVIPIIDKGTILGQPDMAQVIIEKHRTGYYEMHSIQQHTVQRSQHLQPGDIVVVGKMRMKFTHNENKQNKTTA